MIEELDSKIRSYLLDDSDINLITDGQVYPQSCPDPSIYPRVTFWWVSYLEPIRTLGGTTSYSNGRLQLDLWDRSHSPANAILLRTAVLNRLSGTTYVDTWTLHSSYLASGSRTLTEPPEDGSNAAIHHTILEFELEVEQGSGSN